MRKYIVARKNIVSLALVLAVVITSIMCVAPKTVKAASAKLYINASSKTIDAGRSTTLKVGTKKKVLAYSKKVNGVWKDYYETEIIPTSKTVKWSTNNKKVATVSSKGKVTGKKTGACTVTAKVGFKSYKCKVTVKRPVSKDLIEFEEIPVSSYGCCNGGVHLCMMYKVTNNNDYPVQFDIYERVEINGEIYYTGNDDFDLIQTCLLNPGESSYVTAGVGPEPGTVLTPIIKHLAKAGKYGKLVTKYKKNKSGVYERIYKRDNRVRSAISEIEMSVDKVGDNYQLTVKNNADFDINYLELVCVRIEDGLVVDEVILRNEDFVLESPNDGALKSGKTCTYTFKENEFARVTFYNEYYDENGEEFWDIDFDYTSKPDKVFISYAGE